MCVVAEGQTCLEIHSPYSMPDTALVRATGHQMSSARSANSRQYTTSVICLSGVSFIAITFELIIVAEHITILCLNTPLYTLLQRYAYWCERPHDKRPPFVLVKRWLWVPFDKILRGDLYSKLRQSINQSIFVY